MWAGRLRKEHASLKSSPIISKPLSLHSLPSIPHFRFSSVRRGSRSRSLSTGHSIPDRVYRPRDASIKDPRSTILVAPPQPRSPASIFHFRGDRSRRRIFPRKLGESRDQTSRERLVSHGRLLPIAVASRLATSRSNASLLRPPSRRNEERGQRLNDRIPVPPPPAWRSRDRRISTN